MVSSRQPRRQKTKEKLKNPQQPNTRALESQEGLKRPLVCKVKHKRHCELESQEGLKRIIETHAGEEEKISEAELESQEGLKLHICYLRLDDGGDGLLESQEGLKLHVAARVVHYLAVSSY